MTAVKTSIKILGTGHYLPERVVTNDDFTAFVDTSDEWISTRTGMQKRHIAVEDPAWHMGAVAAQRALAAAGLSARDIDMIVVSTCTPDYFCPSAAGLIQRQLGIKEAMAFDVNAACNGFTVILDMARRYLATGDVQRVLLVGTEALSQYVDYTDRASCILFGDGAGACVVEKAEGLYGAFQANDTEETHIVYGKRRRRTTPFGEAVQESRFDLFPAQVLDSIVMNGRELYKLVVSKAMPEAVAKACARAGVAISDLAMIFPHQANLRILQAAAKNMKISMDKIYENIGEYANTSSATVPIGLDEGIRAGKIRRGDTICLVGFGAGINYGAVALTY